MALASLVLGICSITLSIWGCLFGATAVFAQIVAINGIVLAAVGLYNHRKAAAGLACSCLGATISLVPAIIYLLSFIQ